MANSIIRQGLFVVDVVDYHLDSSFDRDYAIRFIYLLFAIAGGFQ